MLLEENISKIQEVDFKDFSFDDLDFELITFAECSIFNKEDLEFEKFILKRAVELGFQPDFLTEEQRNAAILCISEEEFKPFNRGFPIMFKNYRLRKKLTPAEKEMVKAHVMNTKIFGNLDSIKSEKTKRKILEFSDRFYGICALYYSILMRKYNEKEFGGAFEFLPPKRRNAAVNAGSRYLFNKGFIKFRSFEDGKVKQS